MTKKRPTPPYGEWPPSWRQSSVRAPHAGRPGCLPMAVAMRLHTTRGRRRAARDSTMSSIAARQSPRRIGCVWGLPPAASMRNDGEGRNHSPAPRHGRGGIAERSGARLVGCVCERAHPMHVVSCTQLYMPQHSPTTSAWAEPSWRHMARLGLDVATQRSSGHLRRHGRRRNRRSPSTTETQQWMTPTAATRPMGLFRI